MHFHGRYAPDSKRVRIPMASYEMEFFEKFLIDECPTKSGDKKQSYKLYNTQAYLYETYLESIAIHNEEFCHTLEVNDWTDYEDADILPVRCMATFVSMLNKMNVKKVPSSQLAFICPHCVLIRNCKREIRLAKLSKDVERLETAKTSLLEASEHLEISKIQRDAFRSMRHRKNNENPFGINKDTCIVQMDFTAYAYQVNSLIVVVEWFDDEFKDLNCHHFELMCKKNLGKFKNFNKRNK
jgi:hypothetical protein